MIDWISVKEKGPPEHQTILLLDRNNIPYIGQKDGYAFCHGFPSTVVPFVTHWAEITLPEKETK